MQPNNWPTAELIDLRSYTRILPDLLARIPTAQFIGLDIETQDSNRHAGLNALMNTDDEGHKAANKALIFDVNRTVVTGFSIYLKDEHVAYYVNLAHADVENRLPWEIAKLVIEAKSPNAYFIAHNAPYEITMLFKSLGCDLGQNILCSLQLAVTCWNDDTYDHDEFCMPGLGGIEKLFPAILRSFSLYKPGDTLENEQEELLSKVIAKESDADHSYNGYVKTMAYSYGLKKLVKRFLGYEQVSFEEVMNGRAHMGQLTGEEVVSYGADDAWTCVKLFFFLLDWLTKNNPLAVKTYFEQENPMIQVFSKVWREGVVADKDAIVKRREIERTNLAGYLVIMKEAVKSLLPFDPEIHDKLVKYDPKGYGKNDGATGRGYRQKVLDWATSRNSDDAFGIIHQTRGPTSNAMAGERGVPESKGLNLTYYQVVRCILYDLCRCSFQLAHGKIQSDADARETMRTRLLKKNSDCIREEKGELFQVGEDVSGFTEVKAIITILDCYKKLSGTEQVVKLYLENYLKMIDPDTGRLYPGLNSMLNTRRMALRQPNLSQLPKNSALAYVRGFIVPDEKDHVIVSADWSSVELVIVGEYSGDEGYKKSFGQIPYQDMHSDAAASVLGISIEEFNARPDKKGLRTEYGKGANFNYVYSGALSTIGEKVGWSSEQMWEAVERYRSKFPMMEKWRTDTIEQGRTDGFVRLPDGLIRYRWEATQEWVSIMRAKFSCYGPVIANFGELVIKRIRNRSGNQMVNADVQGLCATLAKRSILSMEREIPKLNLCARFMFPVHDELVYSVHKDDVLRFLPVLRDTMCTHPDLIKNLVLNCSMAIGKNYWAFDPKMNVRGQMELDEWSKKVPIKALEEKDGEKLNDQGIQMVIDYLMETEND